MFLMTGLGVYCIIASILLLLALVAFVYYCMKGGNLIIGLIITTTVWVLIGIVYVLWNAGQAGEINGGKEVWNLIVGTLNKVYSDGPINYGQTTTIIIFASWFGRVIVDTGIAKALIRKVVELSGNKQLITVLAVSIVSALIFTSVFGPGSVMAIGAIILPILLSIGVSKKIAVGSFLFSVAAGMYVNSGYYTQFSGHDLFKTLWTANPDNFTNNFLLFSWLAFLVHVVIMVGFILFNYWMAKGKVKAWAMEDDGEEQHVSNWSFIVPFIPIVFALIIALINLFSDLNLTTFAPIFLFVVAIFFGLLLTGNLKTYKKALETTQKTLFNGISDVALLIGMLLVMNMFSTAASNLAAPIFQTALGGALDWVNDKAWIVVLAAIILAPLALFRGPFMIWGSGIALASVLSAVIPATSPLLLVLFYVQPVAITADSCPTQSWGMWALSYAKYEPNVYIKTDLPWGWVCCAINILLAFLILM